MPTSSTTWRPRPPYRPATVTWWASSTETPGLDAQVREAGARSQGVGVALEVLAAEPALERIGWAAAGPWSVTVLKARQLTPTDAPALQAALDRHVERTRPALHADPALAATATATATEVIADGQVADDDMGRIGGTGGVPVFTWHRWNGAHFPALDLNNLLAGDAGEIRETWLKRVGVAVAITAGGRTTFMVLATGAKDRASLAAELAAVEPRAAELVNRSRAEAALPPVRLDAALIDAAKALAGRVGPPGVLRRVGRGSRLCGRRPPRCRPLVRQPVDLARGRGCLHLLPRPRQDSVTNN